MTEHDSGESRGRSILQLEHVQGIRIGDNPLITPQGLDQDAAELRRTHPLMLSFDMTPSEQVELVGDEFLLKAIILRMLPITITGDPEQPPVALKATLEKFTTPPYKSELANALKEALGPIPDEDEVTYAVRLVPETGRVARIAYRDLRKLSSWGLQEFSTTNAITTMNLHNVLYVEIHHDPQNESGLLPLNKPEDRRQED